jgi:transposase
MESTTRKVCGRCRQLEQRLEEAEALTGILRAQVADLEHQLAAARKNSSTSSKPPSSDIVKPSPPPTSDGSKRKQGGQPGHPQHDRPLLPIEQLTEGAHEHFIEVCPDCGHSLEAGTALPQVVQQIDIREVPISSVQHSSHAGWCPQCQRHHFAPLPSGIAVGGLVGPT